MALPKTQQKRLLNLVRSLLTARRNMNVRAEQSAWDKLSAYCSAIGVDMGAAIEQGEQWLKRNSIAASMNGIV